MIKIVCDSTCDYTREEAEALGITLVPLKVLFGTEEFYDGQTISPEAFYEKLAQAKELPVTSQPSPEAFVRVFRAAKEAGDTLICILLASNLSGTCQSAVIAKEIVEYDRIHIVDSLQVTAANQLLAREALRMRDAGASAEEILEALERDKKKVRIYAMVDTLLYLQKGGRLSAAGMVAGSALHLKPIITVVDGEVKVAGIARGCRGAYEKMLKLMEEDGGMDTDRPYVLGYTGKRECLDPFVDFVKERIPKPYEKIVAVGPVIGAHAGPGVNAMAVFLK